MKQIRLLLLILLLPSLLGAVEVREVAPLIRTEATIFREFEDSCWRLLYSLEGGESVGSVSALLSQLIDGSARTFREESYCYQLLVGRLAFSTGDYDRALTALRDANRLVPTAAEPQAWIAATNLKLGRVNAALTAAELALELDPLQIVAREVAQGALLFLNEGGETQVFSTENPDALDALYAGDAAYSRGDYDTAAAGYLRALEYDPTFIEARVFLGDCYYQTGEFPAALKEYETATELQPDYARAWNFRGDALQALSRFDEAADSYRRAIELDPEYASPATKLRQLELMNGE